jgi:hypothetical protein
VKEFSKKLGECLKNNSHRLGIHIINNNQEVLENLYNELKLNYNSQK